MSARGLPNVITDAMASSFTPKIYLDYFNYPNRTQHVPLISLRHWATTTVNGSSVRSTAVRKGAYRDKANSSLVPTPVCRFSVTIA